MNHQDTKGTKGLRAFEVECEGWKEATCIQSALTAAQAKYKSWRGAREAGFDFVTFGLLRARRAPEFDCVAEKIKHGMDRTGASLLKIEHERKQRPQGCPNDTAGDGNCGRRYCPHCGEKIPANDCTAKPPSRQGEEGK